MVISRTIISAFFCLFFLNTNTLLAQTNEQLLLFIQTQNPSISQADQEAVAQLAETMELDFKVIPVENGAPKSITYTPCIVFQNADYRSFYYGRYKNTTRLKNFIRSARMFEQESASNPKKEILTWQTGRTSVTAPLKITSLSGELPKKFNQQNFQQLAKQAFAKDLSFFKIKTTFQQTRTTRTFYIDLHPHLDSQNQLSISAAIYSQYNCINPIFQQFESPLVKGKWKQRTTLFAEAGRLLEAEIKRQQTSSTIGDAFQAIADDIPVKDWESLGLNLPDKAQNFQKEISKDWSGTGKWKVTTPENTKDPIIIFSFPAPLDNYAGEVKKLSGNMHINKDGIKGKFEVDVKDITMGDAAFDDAVQNKMLKKSDYPKATYTFDQIKDLKEIDENSITFTAIGTFTMKGISMPLEVPAIIRPFFNEKENISFQVNIRFRIPLWDTFQIAGPDGPTDASNFLQFYMKFNMNHTELP